VLIEVLERTARDVAKTIARNAAIGGVADGIFAAVDSKPIIKEVGCGVVTSGAGTVAREVFWHLTKNTGKWGHIVGVGASIGARYAYRQKFCKEEEER